MDSIFYVIYFNNYFFNIIRIEYKHPNENQFKKLDFNGKTLEVRESVLESVFINTKKLEKGIYPISTEIFYVKGNLTESVDLSLNLEVY
tara:strand:+ start:917 stop:1183 length:267 start_codon:yes stop_codon:yes gene_type:complete